MNDIAIVLLDGIVFASYLFLVSAGLTFIYGVMRILNVAHGSLYGFGAYAAAWLLLKLWPQGDDTVGALPLWLSYLTQLGAAFAVGVTLGPLLERLFIRRLVERGEIVPLLGTFGLLLILDDAMKLIWGVSPLLADMPYALLGSVRLAGITYPIYPFMLALVALAAALAMWYIINRTTLGTLIVCVIADRQMSSALGINVPRIYTVAFMIGAITAAVGGAFIAPMVSVVPGISVEVIVLAFAVTTIGGLGSVPGAAIGAVMVGILRSAAVHTVPELDLFVIYALMTVVLLIKPQGLFGAVEARRI
jgi:branched-chain amino acid transport system permease protein